MFVIGVTGGIGSGKSAATDCFAQWGIDIVDADIASRAVVKLGMPALQMISKHFGNEILLSNGELNRAELRKRIFNNDGEKQWLEALLHPLISEQIERGINSARSPYVILVSPLLIEAKQALRCDRILVIDVPEQVQVQRTIARDSNDESQIHRIMANQASRQQRLDIADDVIDNTAGLAELQQRVKDLHLQYLLMATKKSNKPQSSK